jgi:hypothetical protein
MKKTLLTATLFTIVIATNSFGATIGPLDTFQDGTTDGWFAGGLGFGAIPLVPPHVVATGGPAGAGDQFLQIASSGILNDPGSRLVAMNSSQWSGNYLTSGLTAIAMDLKNFGNSDLTIRLLFEDPLGGPPADIAVTTFGAFLPVGSAWTHVVFALSPASLTPLMGSATTALSNTTLLRIIDSPTPSEAVTIAGVLGVDNIAAVPEPASALLMATGLLSFGAFYWRRQRLPQTGRASSVS